MALLGCVLIMYKAIWYDQFTCPDGFLLRVRPGKQRDRLGSGAVQADPVECPRHSPGGGLPALPPPREDLPPHPRRP